MDAAAQPGTWRTLNGITVPDDGRTPVNGTVMVDLTPGPVIVRARTGPDGGDDLLMAAPAGTSPEALTTLTFRAVAAVLTDDGSVWFGHPTVTAQGHPGHLVIYAAVLASGGVVASVDLAHPTPADDLDTLLVDGLPEHLRVLAEHHPDRAAGYLDRATLAEMRVR